MTLLNTSEISIVDTHAHICDPVFDLDRAEVLARAGTAGVKTVIAVGEDIHDAAVYFHGVFRIFSRRAGVVLGLQQRPVDSAAVLHHAPRAGGKITSAGCSVAWPNPILSLLLPRPRVSAA